MTAFTLLNCSAATMSETGEPYSLIEDAQITCANGKILSVGKRDASLETGSTFDLGGRLVTPGLIDCHTHLVFAGNRANEFEMRLNGASYADISKAGGGINASVAATRRETEEELLRAALPRAKGLLREGVTTIEVKSGYGLDTANEMKMLRVARALGEQINAEIVTSFLGAHALPPEFQGRQSDYIDLVCDEMLPAVAEAGLADAVDGFCEGIAFTVDEMARVFDVAKKYNLPVKLHAEQLSDLGGAKMAAKYGALSCDHLEYIGDDGIAAMAEAGTVAVLAPGAFYYLHETQKPPIDAFRQHKVPMAVGTDLNPGSSPVYSLLSAMNMACVLFAITPQEALAGVTRNAAKALGLADRGCLEAGKKADLAIWDVAQPGELSYPLGVNPCAGVIQNGDISFGSVFNQVEA